MSDVEDPKENNKASQTDVSTHVQTISLDKITQTSESRVITINVYPNITPKSDKPVQTETSSGELVPKTSQVKGRRSGNLASESREIGCFDYTPSTFRKTPSFISHETKLNKLMNSRKFPDSKPPNRTATDLERKKLEAELKATEEIAKIQQNVIEKRLALELASLQDANEYHQKMSCPQQSMPHADLKSIEEIVSRKHSIISHVTKDVEPKEHHQVTRTQPPRPPPPTRLPISVPVSGVRDLGKNCLVKTDSSILSQTSSDANPLRHLVEKKILLEKRSSKTQESKSSLPLTKSNSRECRANTTYPETRNFRTRGKSPIYQPPEQPGCSPQSGSRSRIRSLWKQTVTKVRKKLKSGSKSPEDWD